MPLTTSREISALRVALSAQTAAARTQKATAARNTAAVVVTTAGVARVAPAVSHMVIERAINNGDAS